MRVLPPPAEDRDDGLRGVEIKGPVDAVAAARLELLAITQCRGTPAPLGGAAAASSASTVIAAGDDDASGWGPVRQAWIYLQSPPVVVSGDGARAGVRPSTRPRAALIRLPT